MPKMRFWNVGQRWAVAQPTWLLVTDQITALAKNIANGFANKSGFGDSHDEGKMKKSAVIFAVMLSSALESYVGGMPTDLLGKVRASIESRYPDNYSMQKTLIDDQVQSYEYLQGYSPSSVPSDVFREIKESIETRYPYNFSMQKTLIQDEVQSYEYLKVYAPSDIPSDVLDRIRNTAFSTSNSY